MIIRHQGRTLIGDELISGYAVCEADKLYMYLDDGKKIQVKRSSVVPVLADLENCKVEQPRESYGHPLCSLEVSEYIQASLRFKGVMCLEDLAKWTYEDFKRTGTIKNRKNIRKIETIWYRNTGGVNLIQ